MRFVRPGGSTGFDTGGSYFWSFIGALNPRTLDRPEQSFERLSSCRKEQISFEDVAMLSVRSLTDSAGAFIIRVGFAGILYYN